MLSILNQKYKDFEIIIVDDNPISNIELIIKEFRDQFKIGNRFKYYKNSKNLGYPGSLDKALSLSEGKYIAIIDDDDEWIEKNKLKMQVDFLEKNPSYVLVGTGLIQIDENGSINKKLNPESDIDLKSAMLLENNFSHSSVMYKRVDAIAVGGYSIKNWKYYSEDEIMWIKLGTRGKIANLPNHSLRYSSTKRGPIYIFLYRFIPSIRQFSVIIKYKNFYPNFWKAITARFIISLRCLILIFSELPIIKHFKETIKNRLPNFWRLIYKLITFIFTKPVSFLKKTKH